LTLIEKQNTYLTDAELLKKFLIESGFISKPMYLTKGKDFFWEWLLSQITKA